MVQVPVLLTLLWSQGVIKALSAPQQIGTGSSPKDRGEGRLRQADRHSAGNAEGTWAAKVVVAIADTIKGLPGQMGDGSWGQCIWTSVRRRR